MADNKKTALAMRDLIRKRGFAGKGEERAKALDLYRQFPEQALTEIQNGSEEPGVTLLVIANALEDVLGEIPDPKRARDLFEAHVAPGRRVDLLQVRGDLPSIAATVASLDDIHMSLVAALYDSSREMRKAKIAFEESLPKDLVEDLNAKMDEDSDDANLDLVEDDEAATCEEDAEEQAEKAQLGTIIPSEEFVANTVQTLRSWAIKINDRPDYQKFLTRLIAGRSIRDHLLYAVWVAAEKPTTASKVSNDLLQEVGLNTEEHVERLAEMIGSGEHGEDHEDFTAPVERNVRHDLKVVSKRGFPRLHPQSLEKTFKRLVLRRKRMSVVSTLDTQRNDEVDKAKKAASF